MFLFLNNLYKIFLLFFSPSSSLSSYLIPTVSSLFTTDLQQIRPPLRPAMVPRRSLATSGPSPTQKQHRASPKSPKASLEIARPTRIPSPFWPFHRYVGPPPAWLCFVEFLAGQICAGKHTNYSAQRFHFERASFFFVHRR